MVAIVGVVADPAKTTAQRYKIKPASYKRSSGQSPRCGSNPLVAAPAHLLNGAAVYGLLHVGG